MMRSTHWLLRSLFALQIVWQDANQLLANALAESATIRRVSIVTGASGYVGRETVFALVNDKSCDVQKIYCLVRPGRVQSELDYWKSISDDITVMAYDMLDGGASIRDALDDACRVALGDDKGESAKCCVYHIASMFLI